jgi:hypothetical protein
VTRSAPGEPPLPGAGPRPTDRPADPEAPAMPLSDDVHAAVDRYQRDVVHAVARIQALATDVETLSRWIAEGGRLGSTSDPDLTRARQQLARARALIAAAATAVTASAEPCRQYAQRAFPR